MLAGIADRCPDNYKIRYRQCVYKPMWLVRMEGYCVLDAVCHLEFRINWRHMGREKRKAFGKKG